jgi:hypothetical protein
MVPISNFTTIKIMDKRPGPSGVEYKCEFEPTWLATDLVETAQMGSVCIRSYENECGTVNCPDRGRSKRQRMAKSNSEGGPKLVPCVVARTP